MVLGSKLVNHSILIVLLDNVKNLCGTYKPIAHLPSQEYYSYCQERHEKGTEMTVGTFYRFNGELKATEQWTGNVEAFITNYSDEYQATTSCGFAKSKHGILFVPHKMSLALHFGGGLYFTVR